MNIDPQEQFLLSALLLRGKERTLLSSNIANAKTPHYHARHLDFEGALNESLQKQQQAIPAIGLNAAHHQHFAQPGLDINTLKYVHFTTHRSESPDGNTVNMNDERAAFVNSTIHENLLLSLLKNHYHQIEIAISGQL